MEENTESNNPHAVSQDDTTFADPSQKELTEEEKRQIELQNLISSQRTNKPQKVYNAKYRKDRKAKNRAAKKSRKNSKN